MLMFCISVKCQSSNRMKDCGKIFLDEFRMAYEKSQVTIFGDCPTTLKNSERIHVMVSSRSPSKNNIENSTDLPELVLPLIVASGTLHTFEMDFESILTPGTTPNTSYDSIHSGNAHHTFHREFISPHAVSLKCNVSPLFLIPLRFSMRLIAFRFEGIDLSLALCSLRRRVPLSTNIPCLSSSIRAT